MVARRGDVTTVAIICLPLTRGRCIEIVSGWEVGGGTELNNRYREIRVATRECIK